MKFVALTLALLLAVGSHAASLQADAPDTHPAVVNVLSVMPAMQEHSKKIFDQLSDEALKAKMKAGVDTTFEHLINALNIASPGVTMVDEMTKDLRQNIDADIKEINVVYDELKTTLLAHAKQYLEVLKPVAEKYGETLKPHVDTAMTELGDKFSINVEETKAVLRRFVEKVIEKGKVHVEAVKTMAGPYVNEMMEKSEQIKNKFQTMPEAEWKKVVDEVQSSGMNIKNSLASIVEVVSAAITPTQ